MLEPVAQSPPPPEHLHLKPIPWPHPILIALVLVLGAGLWLGWTEDAGFSTSVATPDLPEDSVEPITPLPLKQALDQRKVALGGRLFHDPRLSADGSVSCASCHDLARGGVDRRVRSLGVGAAEGNINAPTVFNSGFNFRQFWDGRVESLEDQVNGPLQHPAEMASTWPAALARIGADPGYRAEFAAIYRDGVEQANVRDAIATFERSLVTPNSRFDRYLRGDRTAITDAELHGYRLFKEIGCTSCHQGVNIGGNSYQRLGVMADYFGTRGSVREVDRGRFNITGREEDRYFFKVPSLRNVALTPPYLHDGSAHDLSEVVTIMARYQLDLRLSSGDVERIVAFLHTLTGEYQGRPLQ